MYKLKKNDVSITNILGSINDFMNEVFIAQTTRKSIDILCIQNNDLKSKKYIICEVKTDRCRSDSLSQVLYYVDLFKRKELVSLCSDIVFGCLIGKRFDTEVLEFSKKRNKQNINGKIILIEYNPYKNGTDAKLKRLA
jgi:RecB family endonuclease NucS